MFGMNYTSVFMLLSACVISCVTSHGYIKTPRSRQWVAAEDGRWSGGADTLPAKENCPSCANTKSSDGFCGIVDNRDYDNPKDSAGLPLVIEPQEVYTEGQIIDTEFVFTANHNGHHVLRACPDTILTKECFKKYPLEFMEDISVEAFGTDYNAPKDPNYPERAYVNQSASHTKMRFKLPAGLTGDKITLQWHWVTGNSCMSAGYDDYAWPPGWKKGGMGPCPDEENLSPTGEGQPEQFWNCVDVKIVPDGVGNVPTKAPITTPTATSPTTQPTTDIPTTGTPCCSDNLKRCISWCPECNQDQSTCESSNYFWMPWGEPVDEDSCIAITYSCVGHGKPCCPGMICDPDAASAPCIVDTSPPVASPPTPPTGNPPITPSPTSDNGCCSQDFKTCDATWCGDTKADCLSCGTPGDHAWLPNGPVQDTCIAKYGACTDNVDGCCYPAVCEGNQWYRQCLPGDNPPPTKTPTKSTPSPVKTEPTSTPVTSFPTVATTSSPTKDINESGLFFTTSETMKSYDALKELDPITRIIEVNPPVYSIIAEGGAAGTGGDVVSEGQGYGVMIAGITLAAMESNDPYRADTMSRFEGYFNGWKRMCINSTPKSYCQSAKLCGGGLYACLPGWKHDGKLTEVIGTGAAPDGDQDAIMGMILAVKAVQNDTVKPGWYDEVRVWADASSTSFLFHNTKPSKTGSSARIVKLGSCWGGWETEGNNPSYHSPGSYRLMKSYQEKFSSGDRNYAMPTFDDGKSMSERWDLVIETSYKFLEAAKCDDMGLVPNWAMATETSSGDILVYPGTFSGSGTPQYEFGAEASRTVWRVLIDAILFPAAAYDDVDAFLRPLHDSLVGGYSESTSGWSSNTLSTCDGVNTVFPNWRYNAFIYSPVYSTLALKIFSGASSEKQQKMVDDAGALVNNIPGGLSYYSRCWSIIGILTLNGDLAKANDNDIVQSPTKLPTMDSPNSSPTISPISTSTHTPTKTESVSPTKPRACKPWCADSTAPWTQKCSWNVCSLCAECQTEETDTPTMKTTDAPTVSPSLEITDSLTKSPTLVDSDDEDDSKDDDERLVDDELIDVLQEIAVALKALIDILNALLSVLGVAARIPY